MGIGTIVIVSLNLESAMNADSDFICSSLFELVEDQLKGDDSRKNSSIRWRNLGSAKCADIVTGVQMFVKSSNPFAASDGISECCRKTGRAKLRKSANGEEFCNKVRNMISTLVQRQ